MKIHHWCIPLKNCYRSTPEKIHKFPLPLEKSTNTSPPGKSTITLSPGKIHYYPFP